MQTQPNQKQWVPQSSGTEASFRGISAVSARIAWASGTQGTVLRTLDGGTHWQALPVPGAEKLDFRDIQAFDASTACVLSIGPGEQSRIYQTKDGGKSWQRRFTNPNPKAFYDGFAFWDRAHGIAFSDSVDGAFPLLITNNGQTWKPLLPNVLPPALPKEGAFAASGTCIAVSGKKHVWFVTGGPAARVFHSPDRGAHWDVVTTPILSGKESQGIFSIAFLNERQGVIVGGDYSAPEAREKTAAYTNDGGKTWTLAQTFPRGFRSAVGFVPGTSPTLWVAVGTNGADYSHDGGQTWHPLGNHEHNALSLTDSQTGWAVGPKGKIFRLK